MDPGPFVGRCNRILGATKCFYKDTSSQGRRTSIAAKQKSAPLYNKALGEKPQIKRNLKSVSTPRESDMAPITRGTGSAEIRSRKTTSKTSMGYRTYFDDPKQVRQWVASAAGSQCSNDEFCPVLPGTSKGNENLTGLYASEPDYSRDSALHSSVSLVSASCYNDIANFHEDNMCTASAGNSITMAGGNIYALNPLLHDTDLATEQVNYDAWSTTGHQPFAIPGAVDMMYTTSADLHSSTHGDYSDELGLQSYWTGTQFPEQEGYQEGHIPCSTNAFDWSPTSATLMDPSISSSYSQSSLLAPHSDSLRSSTTQEDVISIDLDRSVKEDYRVSPLTIGGSLQVTPLPEGCDEQIDMTSTLRPTQTFQRPPLSNLAIWPNRDPGNYSPMAGTFMDTHMQRRPSGEAEISIARCDELYQVGPQKDGLYHCPFEKKNGCTHKPEKLKCNYDKHLDSHLKPYRCKVHSCVAVPFSSTACLLRHEREAHGMHGHGEKPYLCSYEDCERSVLGNGFPRRWNLQDHMKRVHDYTGPPSSNGSTSPTPSSASSQLHGKANLAIRKRRTSNNSQPQAMKRPKSTSEAKVVSKTSKDLPVLNSHGKQRQTMQKQWDQQHAVFKERVECLDPHDVVGLEQIGANYQALHTIGMSIRRLEAGQLANHG